MSRWRTEIIGDATLIQGDCNPLPNPPPSMDDFHKVTLEVSYGAIRRMDAIIADGDGFQKE